MPYYAHSRKDTPRERWHSLETHLHDVADLAGKFAGIFDSRDWGFNAGLLHDVGKAADAFQAYLMRENGLDDAEYDVSGFSRVNHSSAGASLAEDRMDMPGRVLAYLVAGHHAGLPDWYPSDTGLAALSARLPEGRQNLGALSSFAEAVLSKTRPISRPPAFVKRPEDFHLWIRMLFSCLVDADFLDTEKFMDEERASGREGFSNIEKLSERFSRKMEDIEHKAKLKFPADF